MPQEPAPRRWRHRSRSRVLAVALATALLSGMAAEQPQIVSPDVDQTVHSNSGDVRVVVAGVPPRRLVQPLLDGVAASAPVEPPELDLHGVARGEHVLIVKIVDADGREVGRTAAVRFYVFHASKLIRPQPH